MATKTSTTEVITIPGIRIEQAVIKLVGDSPLIVHAWDEKAKRQILDKQMKKATTGKEAKNPIADVINSLYWLTEKPTEMTEEAFAEAIQNGARFGFPATGFKASAVSGAFRAGVTKNKTVTNGAFHIDTELVEILGTPKPREDMVRIALGGTDIRYRGQFDEWSALLPIRYNANAVSLEQLVNIFNLGGFACGVGEWRPEKSGSFGMFHVAG